ncbi:MAG: phosphoribosylformylglycinamidine synthase I [Puniceicoccaceae bacterium]
MFRIAIIVFPGSNCETESAAAIRRAGMEPVEFLWNGPTETLQSCDGFFLVGGFSYEDRSRAGIIASLDPVIQTIRDAADSGKPVLGICNGAQILVETGIVPGTGSISAALAANQRLHRGQVVGHGFFNTWVNLGLACPPPACAFTRLFPPQTNLSVPIAHAEGRFVLPPDLLPLLEANQQVVFRYVDSAGHPDPAFPTNPNGSVANIAALSNHRGNALAIMPHPERTAAGDLLFTSLRDYLEAGSPTRDGELQWQPAPASEPLAWVPQPRETLLPIHLIITDNVADSVERALQNRGFSLSVERQVVWGLQIDPSLHQVTLDQIHSSGVLYNSNKEYPVTSPFAPSSDHQAVLISEPMLDVEALRRYQNLQSHFSIPGLQALSRRTFWRLSFPQPVDPQTLFEIALTHIFHNPVSDKLFRLAP